MPQSAIRNLHAAIYLAVSTLLLALVLRTWLVMGIIAPVTVAGSSMAPSLRGPFAVAMCPNCQSRFDVGAEFAGKSEYATCPHCGLLRVPLASSPLNQGDRLWIDRTLFTWRKPRRWEVVVLRQPDDGRQLCIKRVIGLPGESVRLSSGDVWVNGHVVVKSFGEQCTLRRVVHREDNNQHRWKSSSSHQRKPRADFSGWQWQEGHWQCTVDDAKAEHRLCYVQSGELPITDNFSYNAGLSRKLNRVRDFMLAANLRVAGEGTLTLEHHDGRRTLQVTICPSDGSIQLEEDNQTLWSGSLSADLNRDEVQLAFSTFDRQLLLVLAGHVQLRYPLNEEAPSAGTARPFAVGVRGLTVSLDNLILYRDVYYDSHAVGTLPPMAETPAQLAENEYYVLGDNPPISVDSRFWGPVPGRLLLGGPIGVR